MLHMNILTVHSYNASNGRADKPDTYQLYISDCTVHACSLDKETTESNLNDTVLLLYTQGDPTQPSKAFVCEIFSR